MQLLHFSQTGSSGDAMKPNLFSVYVFYLFVRRVSNIFAFSPAMFRGENIICKSFWSSFLFFSFHLLQTFLMLLDLFVG